MPGRRREQGAGRRVLALAVVLAGATLAGCSTRLDEVGMETVDPAKYTFYKCPDLAQRSRVVMKRERELRELMAEAEKGAGGQFVSALAYRSEYVSVRGDLNLIHKVAAQQNCTIPNWDSDQVIR